MKEIGLYIHIPFCAKKCLYCDFNSYDNKTDQIDAYIRALVKELELYQAQNDFQYKTVFFGGGTPTFIHYKHIGSIMNAIADKLSPLAEISIECNPGTVDYKKLRYYRDTGINRLSIGLQAWQDELLEKAGRIHRLDDFISTYKNARAAGFDNISVDLMFSLPGQTQKMWRETLHRVMELKAEHISCYSLKLEEGTEFYRLYQSNQLDLLSDEEDRQMYHSAQELLSAAGYRQYEISNFARPGKESRHNLIYWHNQEYLGVGAGSHSKLEQKRFWNTGGLEEYIAMLLKNNLPIEGSETVLKDEEMWETIFLALRLNEGLDIHQFNQKYQVDFEERYQSKLHKLSSSGLIIIEAAHIKLTIKGMDLSNAVFMEFME